MKNNLFLGIDIGSRTGKIVIINEKREILFSLIKETIGNTQKTYDSLVCEIPENLKNNLVFSCATGYGRNSIEKFVDFSATEITAHFLGVKHTEKDVKTIIDIGGQDSKVISIDKHGEIRDFMMNDRCAAGTGRFLEVIISRLGFSFEDFKNINPKSKNTRKINATCTVFAESEIVSLMAENVAPEELALSTALMGAQNIVFMIKRMKTNPPYFMTGGVSKIDSVRFYLEQMLSSEVKTNKYGHIMGALGASILANKKWRKENEKKRTTP
jgi:predicted CoA-substrate-specific enzyme activase